MSPELSFEGYSDWLESLKAQIVTARNRAALAVNAELVRLYWQIGIKLLQRQAEQEWGTKVVAKLAIDLREAFPEIKGFSPTNLKYMRLFASKCSDCQIGQQPADQLPWFTIVTLLTKVDSDEERNWYASQVISEGWSRTTLEVNIKNRLIDRQGKAITNFPQRMPAHQAKLAAQVLKDPYFFDFLELGNEALERDIENALIKHITKFLLELGTGFAFVGRQFRLEVGGDEFFIDLLFYHTRLKRYVVIELKATAFKPEHAGQLNFYLSAVDAQVKATDDEPTIGLLLCKMKNQLVVQYALAGIEKPIGVAEYALVRSLPTDLAANLPSIEEFERELSYGVEPDQTNEEESDSSDAV